VVLATPSGSVEAPPKHAPIPIAEAEERAPAVPAASVSVETLESDEEAHLAEVEVESGIDAALEPPSRSWELPGLEILADAEASNVGQMDLAARGTRIRETLAHFGIGVNVARIQEGPVVTQYALDVDPGIKLSRIEGLADNLALALSARSIRIEAPIPGEPYVGVEIPNSAFDLVTLKEVLASANFEAAAVGSKLAFALGQDVAGQPFSADLARMPHVLIAGATGSGKSVCVNSIICSLLMRATPTEVKLILIDPKRVEMAQYKGVPHLKTPVIVDTDKAVNALKWTVGTMESRYHEFAQRGVRNLTGYNDSLRAGEPRMPYIVVVIDELADLMMVSAYEVEATITRIAQLARATGIHLVVATQRPSVQVITGLIKANIPSRIAFAMTSGVDSRTILDASGAEDLLGRGDMLYQPIDAPRPVRLQGVLVTDKEIDAVASDWREQGPPEYDPAVTAPRRDARAGGHGDEDGDDADALLSQAIDVVRRSDKASASLLQRRLRIGYARAARILDQMEDRGIVGSADGSRFREVLITPDGWGGDVAPGRDAE
jgi:S-DNA-T family DNA segregation ATPase FtsK/SpoIIIE